MDRYLKVSGLVGLAAPNSSTAAAGVSKHEQGWRLAADPATASIGAPPMRALLAAAQAPIHLACGERDAMVKRDDLLPFDSAAVSLAGVAVPQVHAAESSTIQVALVGCGGRGTGAAANALSVKEGPTKLVAMADVFDHKLKNSYTNLSQKFKDKVRELTERHRNLDRGAIVKLNQVIRGTANYFATSFSTCRWMFQKLDSWIRMRLRAMKLKRKNYHDNYKLRAAYFCRQLGLLTLEGFCTYRDPHGQARRVIPRAGQLRLGSPGARPARR